MRPRKKTSELRKSKNGMVIVECRIHTKHHEQLLEKCKEAGAFATKGPTIGEPSVGALLRLIAQGEIELLPKNRDLAILLRLIESMKSK